MSILFINVPIILIIIFNKLFLFKYQKKGLVFTDYFFFFIKFSIIIALLSLLIFFYGPKIQLDSNLIQAIIILYFLLFICTFLVICTKFTSSPTEIIYSYIKKNKTTNILKLKKYIRKKKCNWTEI